MFNITNSYSKYLVAFVAFTFTLIPGVDFIVLKLRIEINYLPYLLLLLIITFFVGLIFVWKNQKTTSLNSIKKPKKKWTLYLNIFVTIGLGALFVYYFQKGQTDEELLNQKLPEIVNAYDNNELDIVFAETKKLLDAGNTNPVIKSYYDKVTMPVSIFSEPKNIEVSFKRIKDSINNWYFLGKTPLNNIRVPNETLEYKFKTKESSYTEFVHAYTLSNNLNNFILPKQVVLIKDHVMFLGGKKALNYPGVDHLPEIKIGPYSMAKFEVTNKDFKEFMDAEGYSRPEYWDFPYNLDGKELTFKETIKTFLDKYGQFGPVDWSYGSYPVGQENFPVTGISWFEARAYAKYKGLSLPNLYQWANAARLQSASSFVPNSNFSKNQLVEVGSMDSQNPNLLYDIAGNAREWIINSVEETHSKKGILGGGFKDDPYYFNDYFGQNVLDRSISNGMRLVKNLESYSVINSSPESIISIATRDFMNEKPVSDDVFEIFKEQFNYADKPLNAKITTEKISSGTIKADRYEITSPYEENGMLPGYIFYDSAYTKPLKPIIFFPGSNAIHLTNVDYMIKSNLNSFRYLMSEGYALFLPIYLSTYERADELKSDYPNESSSYKEHVIKWGQDYKRTIDYIITRKDMDASNLTYFGVSWGGYMANTLLAIDDRVKSATLYVAGLTFQKSKKEVEAYHYTQRINMPVLMLNGEFDQFFPLETSQIPMFKLLGTKEEDKEHYVSKTGHYVPKAVLIKKHLSWLKKYEN